MKKECVLYDRECVNCGECDICDLNPKKICDNCGACLESDNDYSTVDVDLTLEDSAEPEMLSYEELFPEKAFIGERAAEEDEDGDEFYDQDFEEDFDSDFDDYNDFSEEDDDLESDFGEFFG